MPTNFTAAAWRAVVTLFLSQLLAGCFGLGSMSCEVPEGVANVSTRDPIRVPDDLDDLDESKALKIPTATTPPRPDDAECLDRPPRYE